MTTTPVSITGVPEPLDYLAGINPENTGFTPLSNIGPERDASGVPDDRDVSLNRRQEMHQQDEEGDEHLNDSNFDESAGYGGSLFSKEDEEASAINEVVDKKMDEEKQECVEMKLNVKLETCRQERPKIQMKFSYLKAEPESLTEDDGENIKDVGDARNKHPGRFTPIPDSLFPKAGLSNDSMSTYDPVKKDYSMNLMAPFSGANTAGGLATPCWTSPNVDLDSQKIAQIRNILMNIELDQMSNCEETVAGSEHHLTNLQSTIPSYGANISNVMKASFLLRSVRETNPNYPPAWIASARLEEVAGKIESARDVIMIGCDMCPKSEDIWLEAVRLQSSKSGIETELKAKKWVLQKALEQIPNSVRLWKEAVQLEEPEAARILLKKAVECCPSGVELWSALSRLEASENARTVLNKALENSPTARQVWIATAKLEEAYGSGHMVDKIIDRAVTSLRANGVEINREQWLKDAEDCEKSKSILTCQAIVRIIIGIEDEDKIHIWMEYAKRCAASGAIECARAIYAHALFMFPSKKSVWLGAARFETGQGSKESLESLLQRAVAHCPKEEVLWIMSAKSRWMAGDIPAARSILSLAFQLNPSSEKIWLAAVKLECKKSQYERARRLLAKVRVSAPTIKVVMRSARLEWALGCHFRANHLLEDGIRQYSSHPNFDQLWIMKGKILLQEEKIKEARQAFIKGVEHCPASIPMWLHLSQLEEDYAETLNIARSVLKIACYKNPRTPELLLETVRVELRNGSNDIAMDLLVKAMQQCSSSGMLWAEAIFLESPPQRKAKSIDALKHCGVEDRHLMLAVSKLSWAEGNIHKAREWFNRTVNIHPDFGDAWAFFCKFEQIHGSEEQQNEIKKRCANAKPRQGEEWCKVSQDITNWQLKTERILSMVSDTIEPMISTAST